MDEQEICYEGLRCSFLFTWKTGIQLYSTGHESTFLRIHFTSSHFTLHTNVCGFAHPSQQIWLCENFFAQIKIKHFKQACLPAQHNGSTVDWSPCFQLFYPHRLQKDPRETLCTTTRSKPINTMSQSKCKPQFNLKKTWSWGLNYCFLAPFEVPKRKWYKLNCRAAPLPSRPDAFILESCSISHFITRWPAGCSAMCS